jgi:hypothetical protein
MTLDQINKYKESFRDAKKVRTFLKEVVKKYNLTEEDTAKMLAVEDIVYVMQLQVSDKLSIDRSLRIALGQEEKTMRLLKHV